MTDTQSLPFINLDIQRTTKEIVDKVIGIKQFQANEVTNWSKDIVNQVLENLTQQNNQCKYIVTCVVIQNNGAGIHAASTCYWDNSQDKSSIIKWENKGVYCLVNIFGLPI